MIGYERKMSIPCRTNFVCMPSVTRISIFHSLSDNPLAHRQSCGSGSGILGLFGSGSWILGLWIRILNFGPFWIRILNFVPFWIRILNFGPLDPDPEFWAFGSGSWILGLFGSGSWISGLFGSGSWILGLFGSGILGLWIRILNFDFGNIRCTADKELFCSQVSKWRKKSIHFNFFLNLDLDLLFLDQGPNCDI